MRTLTSIHAIRRVNYYQSRLASLIDENSSNPLRDAGVEAFQGIVGTREQKLDRLKQRFDRLEQTMADLAWLMSNTNRDCEEGINLPGDLPQGRLTPDLFLNLMRSHSIMGDF